MKDTSYIELSRSALKNNFEYLRGLLGPDCRISHVVKGNAYGHGIDEFVPLAQSLGARHFSTFDASEAAEVRQYAEEGTAIMIMGMIDHDQMAWAIEHGVEFYIFDMGRLQKALEIARRQGRPALIHLELETGMNRTGFEEKYWERLAEILRENSSHLYLKGFCTHYAGAENIANFHRIEEQYQRFLRGVEFFKQRGIEAEILHTACSAATIRLPHTRMDMVRLGILQYGYWPSQETYITTIRPTAAFEDPLRRVISWKSSIMSIKEVKQGEFVGYGTSYLAARDMKVAAIPVGYGYGFSRSLSNHGRALIRGERVAVVGLVNMNMMMVDVSDIQPEIGDEVVLIGKQGEHSITVSSFSEYSDQLNYELLTRLPDRIPRKIVD